MRRLGGLALLAVGVLSVVVGITLAIGFGPDDRIETGPHTLRSPHAAIVTAPEALAIAGPKVELRVTSTDPSRTLFVGVAHDVDVRDFLDDTPRTRIDAIDLPWEIQTSEVSGTGSPKAAPGEPDWWIAQAEGRGEVVITWRLPDHAADVVILDRDGRDGLEVNLTGAWVAKGAFVGGLAGIVLGVGVAIFGWAFLTAQVAPHGLHAVRPKEPHAPDAVEAGTGSDTAAGTVPKAEAGTVSNAEAGTGSDAGAGTASDTRPESEADSEPSERIASEEGPS